MTMFRLRFAMLLSLVAVTLALPAQEYKADRLRRAVEKTGLVVPADSLLPEKTMLLKARDGQDISLRVGIMGEVEHVGIPLFNDIQRLLQPSPVYDFVEYAALNRKYKVDANQLYLSKVIFKDGSWNSLLAGGLDTCNCSIENRDDRLYVVTWKRHDKVLVSMGIPVDYELLNNDTRRNMERALVRELEESPAVTIVRDSSFVEESDLGIYGTEGLFVLQGKSYIIDLLNQNTYYKLTSVYETADTIIRNKVVTQRMEMVMPVAVREMDFPAESFANIVMCDKVVIPDAVVELDFHLSDYHRRQVSVPMSKLKAFCRQQGCELYFACDGVSNGKVHGMLMVTNLPKGYNHLFSIGCAVEQLTSEKPQLHADVYLFIPPITKEKMFGIAPKKKSNANFKLP